MGTSIPSSQFTLPSSLPQVHKSLLYICISFAALKIGSSVLFFQIPHICINIWYLVFLLSDLLHSVDRPRDCHRMKILFWYQEEESSGWQWEGEGWGGLRKEVKWSNSALKKSSLFRVGKRMEGSRGPFVLPTDVWLRLSRERGA